MKAIPELILWVHTTHNNMGIQKVKKISLKYWPVMITF
jgi:hypothetical protein